MASTVDSYVMYGFEYTGSDGRRVMEDKDAEWHSYYQCFDTHHGLFAAPSTVQYLSAANSDTLIARYNADHMHRWAQDELKQFGVHFELPDKERTELEHMVAKYKTVGRSRHRAQDDAIETRWWHVRCYTNSIGLDPIVVLSRIVDSV